MPLEVRKSTLCHVKGSSLEALFSGRHSLQTDSNGRIFIDRNFKNFNAIVDYIRNGGQFFESQKKHLDVFENELNYWGISKNDFIKQDMDKFEIIQRMIDEPINKFFIDQNNFGLSQLMQQRMNFKELCKRGNFQVKDDFKIDQMSQIVTIDNGSELLNIG